MQMQFRPEKDEQNSGKVKVGTIVQEGPNALFMIVGYTDSNDYINLLSLASFELMLNAEEEVEVENLQWLFMREVRSLMDVAFPNYTLSDFTFHDSSEIIEEMRKTLRY